MTRSTTSLRSVAQGRLRSTTSLRSVAQGRLRAEPAAEILSNAKDLMTDEIAREV